MRDEDSFSVSRVHEWLKCNIGRELDLPLDDQPQVLQFSGGASNLTYLLTYGDQNLVLRRPPRGLKAASAHDMGREVLIQRSLRETFGYTPNIYAYCTDEFVIGSEFYVMEFLAGEVLRANLPEGVQLSPGAAAELAGVFVDKWARLHALSVEQVGLGALNKGAGYVSRQVEGWAARYQAALTDDVPEAADLTDWLISNQPTDSRTCVIHNDWRFDNLVLNLETAPRLVGVLDWELATVGDPLMDLGSSLAYWVQADDDPGFRAFRRQPTDLPGMPTRQEIVRLYEQASGSPVPNWAYYEVFGLFRLAGIVQQIWFRYRRGETTNPAFANFGAATNLLIDRARKLAS